MRKLGIFGRGSLAVAAVAALTAVYSISAQAQQDRVQPASVQLAQGQVPPALAVPSSGGVIQSIRIDGTQRIEPETVRTYLQINEGSAFDPVTENAALKRLFATGLFADVAIVREGSTLVVKVVENPIINRIAFEGNSAIDDEDLEPEITMQPRQVFTRTRAQQDVERLLAIYRASGRFAANVEPKIIELEQNRVDVVFEISEGEKTYVQSINFIGNRYFSDGELREQVATSETAFWKILSSTDTYDPDRMTFDRELLRRYYLSEGFADFRVVSAVAELTPDRTGFILTFTVEEGERYTFGTIDLVTGLKDLDTESLRDRLTTEEGDWYDAEAIEKSIDKLTDAVGDRGYAFVDIRPRVRRDREAQEINLTYDIQEGPRVFVERIDITGNVRTLDYVIRREFELVEGDAFNASRISRSRRRIQNLGFFKTVQVTNEPGSDRDKTVVKVEVEEQATGEISFGAGFSTTDGILGQVSLRERNLLGRGQDLKLNFSASPDSTSVDLSFTEPYFMGRNLSAGVDVFRNVREQDESSFNQEDLGFSLRAGYFLADDLRQLWTYTFKRTDITDVDTFASLAVQAEAGLTTRSILGQQLIYDVRDNRFDPREGFYLQLGTSFAGIGGDVSYVKGTLGGGYYWPITETVTASIRGEGGILVGLGNNEDNTRITDRFFIGGNQIRGFSASGIGPRDTATGDALGGTKYYSATAELSFPLGLPEDLQIRGRVFADVASLWDTDNPTATTRDVSSARASVGAGISWVSPLGPIQVDLGFPVLQESFDEEELIRFNFGTQF